MTFVPVDHLSVRIAANSIARSRRVLLAGSASALALTMLLQVQAKAEAEATGVATMEAVTVTAERRSQNVQDVGSSISVLSGDDLKLRNVNTAYDLQYEVPNVQVTPQFGSGQPGYTIRGMGFNDYASNNAPTVGVYIDEVAFPIPFGTNGAMFDIGRVEVLRGPQGTLYGRNTTGGAISYILNQPTTYLTGGISEQYGSYNASTTEGYISGPITDKLQFRFSAQTQQGGAWQHNATGEKLGNKNRTGARLLFAYEPDTDTKITVNLHGSYDRSEGNGLHLYTPLTSLNQFYPTTYPVYPATKDWTGTEWGTSASFASEIGIKTNTKPFNHIDTTGVTVRADHDFGFATLSDLVSFDWMTRTEYDNYDASSAAIADVYYNSNANVTANELRLTSPDGGNLTWVAGLYYAHQFLYDNYRSGFAAIYGIDGSVKYSQTVDTVSAFGQASYKLSDQLTVTGGLRLEHELRTLNHFASYFLAGGAVINPGAGIGAQDTEFTKPSGKAEVQYRLATDDMIYFSVSRGIKSGGFTTYNSGQPTVATHAFKPEKVWAYELGNKFEWPEANLRLNVAAYYYDYHDQQIQSAVLNATTGLVGSIVNAPQSHLYGGEAGFDWSPVPQLKLSQSAGLAIGQFEKFDSLLSAVYNSTTKLYEGVYGNRAGDSLPAPKLTLNGSASYSWNIGSIYDLTTELAYSYRGAYRSLFGSRYDVPGYALLNGSISLTPKDSGWGLSLFGQNLTNTRYDVTRNYFVDGDNVALAGMPATWGIRATANF
jgi:iron complex outermembrane recepter protein